MFYQLEQGFLQFYFDCKPLALQLFRSVFNQNDPDWKIGLQRNKAKNYTWNLIFCYFKCNQVISRHLWDVETLLYCVNCKRYEYSKTERTLRKLQFLPITIVSKLVRSFYYNVLLLSNQLIKKPLELYIRNSILWLWYLSLWNLS